MNQETIELQLNTKKNVIFQSLIYIPFLGFLLLGYTIIPSKALSYIYYTAFIVFFYLLFIYFNASAAYVVIKVYKRSIEFYYPVRIIKKRWLFNFEEIKLIDLTPPEVPRSKSSIEVRTINRTKSIHMLHLLDDKQLRSLYQVLSIHSNLNVRSKKK